MAQYPSSEATSAYCCGARPWSILLDPPYPTLFLFFFPHLNLRFTKVHQPTYPGTLGLAHNYGTAGLTLGNTGFITAVTLAWYIFLSNGDR